MLPIDSTLVCMEVLLANTCPLVGEKHFFLWVLRPFFPLAKQRGDASRHSTHRGFLDVLPRRAKPPPKERLSRGGPCLFPGDDHRRQGAFFFMAMPPGFAGARFSCCATIPA